MPLSGRSGKSAGHGGGFGLTDSSVRGEATLAPDRYAVAILERHTDLPALLSPVSSIASSFFEHAALSKL